MILYGGKGADLLHLGKIFKKFNTTLSMYKIIQLLPRKKLQGVTVSTNIYVVLVFYLCIPYIPYKRIVNEIFRLLHTYLENKCTLS